MKKARSFQRKWMFLFVRHQLSIDQVIVIFHPGFVHNFLLLEIVVSVDQWQWVSNWNSNYSQRTSTPIRSSRQSQIKDEIVLIHLLSIPPTVIHTTCYQDSRNFVDWWKHSTMGKKYLTWSKDFARLHANHKKLEENSIRTIFFFSSWQ